jgi:membrane protein DedA with SNARE-associated domain/membrane-associated phospholipid phosphatase
MHHLSTILQPLMAFLHLHPHYAGIIAFTIVFIESLAVVGTIVPGTVTMTALGVLIGAEVAPLGSTFLWGIAGSIVGDTLSYYIGVHYQERLHRIWPFNKYPNLLNRSEDFFRKHGGKSIILGRCLGPMRAMVPMVAGIFKMSPIKFLLVAPPSAILWMIGYTLPGIIIGALSQELPPQVALQFIVAILVLLTAIWLMLWIIHQFAMRSYGWFDNRIKKTWEFLRCHKTSHWITLLLTDPQEPENHRQLSLAYLTIITAALFFVVLYNVMTAGILTALNEPLYHVLTSLRTPAFDHIMVFITLLGEAKVLPIASALLLVWLIFKRYWYIALHWSVLMLVSISTVSSFKLFLFSPRPGGAENFQITSSFPSAHAALSLVFFGFWAVIVARELWSGTDKQRAIRWMPYAASGTIVALIAFSRLYLGAHWLTDIVGSFLLGAIFVMLLTISYRRSHASTKCNVRSLVIASIAALLIAIMSGVWLTYPKKLQKYLLHFPVTTLTAQDWVSSVGKTIPLYRSNRIGNAAQAFNIEWVGNINKIEQALLQQGWTKQPVTLSFHNIIRHLAGDDVMSHLALVPQLYHNHPPILVMTKATLKDKTALVLRLWSSDIEMASGVAGSNIAATSDTINPNASSSAQPLWLGVIDYHYAVPPLIKFPYHLKNNEPVNKKTKGFIGATKMLNKTLPGFQHQEVEIPLGKQPAEMQQLNWDGKLFLVKPVK